MILHVLDALAELPLQEVVVVVGHRADWVTKALSEHAPPSLAISYVEQSERLGTADALAVGLTALPEELTEADGDVVVLPGDTPLLRPPTVAALVRHHRVAEAAATLLTAVVDDPAGYGVVGRGKDGSVARVLDRRSPAREPGDWRAGGGDEADDLLDGSEIATNIHCFRLGVLAPALRRIPPSGDPAEHRLNDVYEVLAGAGYRVESVAVDDPMEVAGVNDRAQLAVAEAELRDRINERWMRRGVTMWDPERTYVDAAVQLAADVVLLPGTILQGACVVAPGAEVGPGCHLVDTEVGAGSVVSSTAARRARIGAGCTVGPFAVLQEGAVVPDGRSVGAFEEVSAEAEPG